MSDEEIYKLCLFAPTKRAMILNLQIHSTCREERTRRFMIFIMKKSVVIGHFITTPY